MQPACSCKSCNVSVYASENKRSCHQRGIRHRYPFFLERYGMEFESMSANFKMTDFVEKNTANTVKTSRGAIASAQECLLSSQYSAVLNCALLL
jgi:hypothetical protein